MDTQVSDSTVDVPVSDSAVDVAVSDGVVHVDGQTTWYDAVFEFFRPSDHQVSDDEIFEILNAGSDGGTAADLCAAKGVTVPMYCVWKAKYRHLSLEELRTARRRELWRGRCQLGGLLAAAVLATGGLVAGLAWAAYGTITAAADSPAAVVSVPATESARHQPAPAAPAQPSAARAPAQEAAPVDDRSRTLAPSPIAEPGYKIQVAAAETLQEGRAIVDQLTAAGYPAYLARATVSNAEVIRVRVGPFDTLSSAEEAASRLRRNGFNGAWIAR